MEPFLVDYFYNPSTTYSLGRMAKESYIEAKKKLASYLGVKHTELIMTSGGSESNNLAISGLMDKFPDKKVLVSKIEHESVIKPAEKYSHGFIEVNKQGLVEPEKLVVGDDVVLLSVMLANNEIGAIQPIAKISDTVRRVRLDRHKRGVKAPLYLHTDACQAPLQLDINAHRLGVDMLSLNGDKIYGPKQTGLIYLAAGIELEPQIVGGGQQRGIRSGTENPAQAHGLAKALEIASARRQVDKGRLQELQRYFIDGLVAIKPNIIINGPRKKRLPSNIHATFFPWSIDDYVWFNSHQPVNEVSL